MASRVPPRQPAPLVISCALFLRVVVVIVAVAVAVYFLETQQSIMALLQGIHGNESKTTNWIFNTLLVLPRLFWRWSSLSYHCRAAVSPPLAFYCLLVLFRSHLSFHIISHLLPTIPTCILVSLTFHLSRNCSYFLTLFFRHLFTRSPLFINSCCLLFHCPTSP